MKFLKRCPSRLSCRSSLSNQTNETLAPLFARTMTRLAVLVVLTTAFHGNPAGTLARAQTTPADNAKDVSPVDPDAVEAVKKMGSYLRSLKSFQVIDDVSNDDVLEDGLIVQNNKKVDLLAAMPNRLRVEVTSDETHRLYLYNGKDFTVWGRLMNYYATVPAPPTISELFKVVNDKYDIELPLIDLFKWGTREDDIDAIKAAVDIGPSTVEGVTCEHYAFHQEGADWQILIQLGEFPLPRRLVIRTLTDDARPQHSDTLTWNLAPSFNEDAFVFSPPGDAKRVVLATNNADATGK